MTFNVFDHMVQMENWAEGCGENSIRGDCGMSCRCCGGWGDETKTIAHHPECGIPAALEREAIAVAKEQIANLEDMELEDD